MILRRAANATAPIVAILNRRAPQSSSLLRQGPIPLTLKTEQPQDNSEVLEHYLNEYLTAPVTGMEVSDLAQRWLLTPPTMGRMVTVGKEEMSFTACDRAALHGASNSSRSALSPSVAISAVSSSNRNDDRNSWTMQALPSPDDMTGQDSPTR